jgi:hypothetical protein
MTRTVRRILLTALMLALTAALVLVGVYHAVRREPPFYRQALAAPHERQLEGGEDFERTALALHNQLQHLGRWETCLTSDEINGWLATTLPEKFPELLPQGLGEPRIAIEDDSVRIAVRYREGGVETVLSIAGEIYLTAQDNEIAIRLYQPRAGLVPVPIARLMRIVSERAAQADIPLRWTEVRGAPVALVRLPLNSVGEDHKRVVVDTLDWKSGRLLVAGRAEQIAMPEKDGDQPVATAGPAEKTTRQR